MSEVSFPIVGSGQAELGKVSCVRLSPEHYPAGRALVLARDEREVERILADARHDEPSGAEITRPIRVRVKPSQFTGESFGLALAIADKRARHDQDIEGQRFAIFATGVLSADGAGRVGAVTDIEAKLEVIDGTAKAGDVVALPKANADAAGTGLNESLDRLAQRGVTCLSVEHLNDVEALWLGPWPPPAKGESNDHSRDDAEATGIKSERTPPESSRPGRMAVLLALLLLLAAPAIWLLATQSLPNDNRALVREAALNVTDDACDEAPRDDGGARERARFFDQPRAAPLQIVMSSESDYDGEAAEAAASLMRELRFTLATGDGCPTWLLDIAVHQDGTDIDITMTPRWTATGKAIFDRDWTGRIAANARDSALRPTVETMINAMLRQLFIQRTVGSTFREEQHED